MKSLRESILEGAGHNKMRLGAGSSGTAYDLGNGFVRKILRIVIPGKDNARNKERDIIDKWVKTKKAQLKAYFITINSLWFSRFWWQLYFGQP